MRGLLAVMHAVAMAAVMVGPAAMRTRGVMTAAMLWVAVLFIRDSSHAGGRVSEQIALASGVLIVLHVHELAPLGFMSAGLVGMFLALGVAIRSTRPWARRGPEPGRDPEGLDSKEGA